MAAVNWTRYAEVYDLMAANNPAYLEIIDTIQRQAKSWDLKPGDMIADLGAGTGNFSLPLAELHPDARVIAIDADRGMLLQAVHKADQRKVRNIEWREQQAEDVRFAPGSLAAAVCVHSLYTFPDPVAVIERLYAGLRPGGILLACDLGKTLNIADWRRYIFDEARARHGLFHALRLMWRGRPVAEHNRQIARLQKAGRYWLHNLTEYRRCFERAGFQVTEAGDCYRGYSQWVVAQKPAESVVPQLHDRRKKCPTALAHKGEVSITSLSCRLPVRSAF